MNILSKKLKNGFEIPAFGIGTWYMGGGLTSDNSKDQQDIEAIKKAVSIGVTHIDTAELYGAGHAEELVGQAIIGYDRSKLFITSKVFKDNLHYKDILESCKKSLVRLGTDYLDLYLIHAPNPEIPLKETAKALDELIKLGLVKNIGVSNFNVGQLKEIQTLLNNEIVVNELHYSLAYQDWQDTVNYCQLKDIIVIAYRPLERGVLTKKGINILDEMCKKYNKTPAQVAINWLISQDNIVTISKTSKVKHLTENLGALGWNMSSEDILKLKNEFPEVELPQTLIKFNK